MVKSISWEADGHSVAKKLSYFSESPRFIHYILTLAHHWTLSWTKEIYSKSYFFNIHFNNIFLLILHCATNQKVAGSIPNFAIRIFHWRNPSGRTLALVLTQPLREMSTRNISCIGLTTSLTSCADCLEIWEPQPPGTLRAYPGL
jgi:hypothetical protein